MSRAGAAPSQPARTALAAAIRFYLPCFFFLLLLSRQPIEKVSAQVESYAYWQYDAAGRLNFASVVDVDNDGVDEFLLAVEESMVVLLDSDGAKRWDYAAEEPVLQLAAVNTNGPDVPGGAVVATQNHLLLLDVDGHLLWRQQLEAPPGAPPAPVVLLTSEDEAAWQSQRAAGPAALVTFDRDNDGREEIVVALKSGLLLLFDSEGVLQWQYPEREQFPDDALPQLQVADLNRDGVEEIVFAYFLPRRENQGGYSKLALIAGDGQLQWERSVTGRLTAMTVADFAGNEPLHIAVGAQLGRQSRLYLYDLQGGERWRRTPNKAITRLAVARVTGGPALLVGTEVGTLVAYNVNGRRLWDRTYTFSGLPDRQVAAISTAPVNRGGDTLQPIVATITLASHPSNTGEPTDILLLDGDGCIVRSTKAAEILSLGSGCLPNPSIYPAVPAVGLATLVDINRDQRTELLLNRFGTLELLDPSVGIPQYTAAENWGGYRLEARPQMELVADITGDGENELLVAADDGRLHVIQRDGSLTWQRDMGGTVGFLALAQSATRQAPPTIVVVHQSAEAETLASHITLLDTEGQPLWEQSLALETVVTNLLVGNIDGLGGPEIIVGTADNQVLIFALTGLELMRLPVSGRLTALTMLPMTAERDAQVYVATGNQRLYHFKFGDEAALPTAEFAAPIFAAYTITEERELATQLVVFLTDGAVYGLNWRGIPLWREQLDGSPQQIIAEGHQLYVATANQTLTAIDAVANNPYNPIEPDGPRESELVIDDDTRLPILTGLGQVSSIYQGYLDRDTLLDVAVGNSAGEAHLFSGDGRALGQFQLVTGIFSITALRSEVLQTDDLLVIADNGVIQLFQARENRPPLLVNPRITAARESYDIEITVIDIENSDVTVTLETWNSEDELWTAQGQRVANGGSGRLTWSLNLDESGEPLRYRFSYDDGIHTGLIEPTRGPAPVPRAPSILWQTAVALLIVGTVLGGAAYLRQSQSMSWQAHRFYNQLKQETSDTLALVEQEYRRTSGSPDFLLNLANRARRDHNGPLASLVDGLFLLANRPEAALPVISSALMEAEEISPPWQNLDSWQFIFDTYQTLLEAPSVTELSLLRPELVELVARQEIVPALTASAEMLLPVLTSLRDSERVELAEDRFVYLHEAAVVLRQLRDRPTGRISGIDSQLMQAIVLRWLGLVNAAVEELRGQAQLMVNLRTKRLIPEAETNVALEIRNTGRAAAENVIVSVVASPAYQVVSPPQQIPFLPSGRTRQVTLRIAPQINERFRLAFQVSYDDRLRVNHRLAFADMVHLLPPVREFSPIVNPYSPGVPLRSHSTLFYGREELFQFIAENAGRLSQQNVLILIGQRRTGKTSAILRLEQYLPESLVPVYIDCQSLGVLPGMAAFFHDLAWLIGDALAARGIDLDIPDPAEWQADPAGRFQRQFIPAARASLPAGTTLLLLFDEFEALENLVSDGILPPTLFTFLRHMMQHGDGLSFVFVGTRRLEEMSTNYWSVLFNIALYRHIGFLDEGSATRLICDPVSPHLVYDDLAIDKILRVTAGHPYFLQLVCYTLINRANQQQTGYITISDVNAALEEMLRLGEAHFAYLWQRSTQTERALLTAVAHLDDRDNLFHPADLVQYLNQYGIRLEPTAVTAGLNLLVKREIMREVKDDATTLFELRIGLVGLWVRHNKSLSKLYESRNGEEVSRETPRTRSSP